MVPKHATLNEVFRAMYGGGERLRRTPSDPMVTAIDFEELAATIDQDSEVQF